jgi:Omp85 superfamily domain
MLGYQQVVTTAFTGSQLIDTSAILAYQNSKSRFNWGGALQRVVYPYPYYSYGFDPATGNYIEQQDITRLINYDAQLFGSYPLSQVTRLQLSAGYRIQDFNHTIYQWTYDPGGFLIDYQKFHPDDMPPALNYAYLSASYFHDTGIFGATSPILGQNFGLSLQQSVGEVALSTLIADYRRYFMPIKPFTLAFRAMHMGRYGKDSEDTRFYPLYIGYWDMLRGYESFSTEELSYYDANPGQAFDYYQLFGSKMFLANVELRFPLLGVLGVGKGFYGAWPLEAFAFYDVGLAYASNPNPWWGGYADDPSTPDPNDVILRPEMVKPWFNGGDRRPLSSYGFGLRTNLFGYFILGLQYVYPVDRPVRGWHFQVSISPGF